ncbi:hypothetical protein QCA50_013878 [Cerrena zonata]|uniref:phosphatidylinositol-3,4,5-trisphosphate 3-phosphatase n=1 Tax=Cerrena zonata TaxID=2478898 RepID=A0AAW0FPI5_9APHY
MTDFVRRLVSGDKARFKDGELDVELDLAYITDRVIVMGYPATGMEGLYRNKREHAIKFLEHRHGKSFWVFNFCPLKENSYPASVFDGRVSRYPFPDHHAPPLAILPLIAREMQVWLDGSPERVAVLHCKAGKGRSGTMACSYLLSTQIPQDPSHVHRSKTTIARATEQAKLLMNEMPGDPSFPENDPNKDSPDDDLVKKELSAESPLPTEPAKIESDKPEEAPHDNLNHVLDLHTSRRMRPPSPGKKLKQGVSIPSQRRWLYYWSLLLAHQEPLDFWSLDPPAQPSPKVYLKEIKLRMRELSGVKSNLVKAATALIDRTSRGKATSMWGNVSSKTHGQVWISLARYDDEMVDTLEKWEKHTRDEDGNFGKRKMGSEHMGNDDISELFKTDKWDHGKMVRSFARLGSVGEDAIQAEVTKDGKVITHLLSPLSNDNWKSIRKDIEADEDRLTVPKPSDGTLSEEPSLYDVTRIIDPNEGIVLDANREVRAKLYIGQVFMGWFWLVPTFHMQHPRSPGSSTTLRLNRKELDFPLGIGANIIDLEVTMEWGSETAGVIAPPARQTSPDSLAGKGEPTGLAAGVKAISAAGNIGEAMEAKQAAED